MSRLPTYQMVRWWFPRLLAAIYLIAFASWGVQYQGLVGRDGISPAEVRIKGLHAAEAQSGKSLLHRFPALQYFNASDEFALGLIATCCGLSVLVIAGVAQRWLLLALWLGYLSISVTGDVFMSFQWDALLLEAGLLAVWLAPGRWWTGRAPPPPPRGSVFLLHWLLFRLMLLSGVVKYWSGDEVWRDMTALIHHYQTQPLPHVLSWFTHHLPRELHIASCWIMYGIELVLPFGIFCGRWGRLVACAGFVAIMAVVFFTGNYNFFNLLTAVLAFTLLDDSWWPRRLRARFGAAVAEAPGGAAHSRDGLLVYFQRIGSAFVMAAVVGLTLTAADASLAGRRIGSYAGYLPSWLYERIYVPVAPLRSFNAYGLFQDMTVERPEIILEVSDDGILWFALEFKWKPGDLKRAPRWAAPHQPRLDWQMWFAALYPGYDPRRDAHPGSGNAWFGEFLAALLQQKQPVWDLLEPPPLPQKSIRHIRARLYRYHFTDPATRAATGEWWRREFLGAYSPSFSLPNPVP
ncbi:MAG TPA: lipase maturation factor family protein [Prosthecobacter sp.]|nr:lipase maturation factor family protein [Prosthecobacter sp.]